MGSRYGPRYLTLISLCVDDDFAILTVSIFGACMSPTLHLRRIGNEGARGTREDACKFQKKLLASTFIL